MAAETFTIPTPELHEADRDRLGKILAALTGAGTGAGTLAQLTRAAGSQTNGSIATGGTAQDAKAANGARNSLVFINTSAAVLYVNACAAATTANGVPVQPGGSVNFAACGFMPTGALSVIGATAGQTFLVIES